MAGCKDTEKSVRTCILHLFATSIKWDLNMASWCKIGSLHTNIAKFSTGNKHNIFIAPGILYCFLLKQYYISQQ